MPLFSQAVQGRVVMETEPIQYAWDEGLVDRPRADSPPTQGIPNTGLGERRLPD